MAQAENEECPHPDPSELMPWPLSPRASVRPHPLSILSASQLLLQGSGTAQCASDGTFSPHFSQGAPACQGQNHWASTHGIGCSA
jgi:hypothetical protein